MTERPVVGSERAAAGPPPAIGLRRSDALFWGALTVLVSLGFAFRVSRVALFSPLIVHDDVRQHVFWVPRLHDPALFAGDWIAGYYEAQAPPAYRAVYWLMTLMTDAIFASKILPLVLTAVLAAGGLALGWALWRRFDAAALGATLLAWSAWQYDDVASATPRSFAMPLLTVQLALLAAGRLRPALAVLALQAVFYPLGCAVGALTIGLWLLLDPRARPLARRLRHLVGLGAVTLVALALIGVGQLDVARYGPVVTAAQARQMPEFHPGGRSTYFVPDPYKFWFESSRSGFALGPKDPWLAGVPALAVPFMLACALAAWLLLGRARLVAPPAVPAGGRLLLVLLAASLLLYAAAHVLLFRLYLPARHVQFSLPIVWALAGGLFWALAAGRVAERLAARRGRPVGARLPALLAICGIAALVLHAPPPGEFYVAGRQVAVYEYLRSTPPDTLVAALPGDSSILPLFGQRPVLTSYEHALPYHLGYYRPLRERTEAFRAAYFAPTLAPLVEAIEREGIGVVVANAEQLARRRRSDRDERPALEAILGRCGVVRERDLVVLPAACIRAVATARP